MKKIIVLLLAVIGFVTTAEAQNVVIQTNETSSAQVQDPNIFYINGIPSTQDIGGVDAQAEKVDGKCYVRFINFHSSTVTILYQVTYSSYYDGYKTITGTIVLGAMGAKSLFLTNNNYRFEISNVATIVRRL